MVTYKVTYKTKRKGRKIRKGEKLGKVSKYEKGDGAGGCGYRMPLISLDKDAKLGFHIATCLRSIKKILLAPSKKLVCLILF